MRNKTILIVDDEERNIKLLKAYLTNDNYHTLSCLDGESALEIAKEECPDLILLDVMMPGIDGFEVCRRLKQDDRTRMIPVIIITALREKQDRIKALEIGADDFLSKPVDQTELRARVRSLLRIKDYHDELRKSCNEISLKNQQLKELERIKEGLTHMIIHDLNNPLMAIFGNLEMIRTENKNLSESQQDRMTKCLHYCDDLRQQIQSLLDIHRMEEGKLKPARAIVDIPALVKGIVEQFTPRAEMEQISICFSNSNDIPPARADQGLIGRVLANLLSNAIRHTPAGGQILAAADYLPESKSVHVSIKDSGEGLAPKYHKRIFDKFEQIQLKDSDAKVGTGGLGLSFCKMAVEAHGGEIWVESEGDGNGSIFNFLIPLEVDA